MSYLNFKSEYDRFPKTTIKNHKAFHGYDEIYQELNQKINNSSVVVFDYYPGVDEEEVYELIKRFNFSLEINMHNIFKDGKTMTEQMKYNLTDDRVFGKMYYGNLLDFMDEEKLQRAKDKVNECKDSVIIYGVGAGLITHGDIYVYFDMARWEIQLRYRKGMPNYNATNYDEDILKKYKRGYFIEWRIADKHKAERFESFDYVVDTNASNDPKMISKDTFIESLKRLAQKPFRTVPYFDPGVWGGQWMKEVCNLDTNQSNYAWSFDGVPEENSILFDYDGVTFELPAMDLVLYQPKELLGEQVYSRFGAEFPIRFDFLDTMEGQNLSLQVHPLTEYIKKNFGMSYTQDESYYILDAKEDAHVYLGLKEGIDKEEMIRDLESAQRKEIVFDADKYINKFPAKKHDHFLIPAGTCHCSGKNAMVLEISATPYIFTFKLWDWQRLGLDGLPRPINIEHGKHVIQWNRTTEWVKENLVNSIYEVKEEENDCKIEHTGLHELEFIETRRYTVKDNSFHKTYGTVNMLNLIDGKSAIIEGDFEPFIVHYAETFIIPASIKEYTIKPYDCDEVKVLKAYVRN
ncbi:mannose-6-phosphate isomerase [Eubacterium sp. AF22-8LB]|uniref:class I mannose-6-phosphate isomerase n=1 Tax=Eubacterium sp. AF22-8LB TaxID=2292232 RepID=UPI000E542E5C|nr:class I mannose-6-phosphate isomerase [Eubacterium sp. AF22-8LB]RGS29970.1 mannose-6-phosphate isomerase [Eubacterium sp. AF22-8LB]